MQGIGPGTILSGRYTAERRTARYTNAEQWTARDSTLDRPVLLLAVHREHHNVAAVLDAARRVAGLDNPRLCRILDVGSDGDISYVVEESLDGALSMAELLAAGPLPAPEVRRIAGEASLVLDVARHRGLHHQQLTPDLVLRTPDGDVKVRGLATMAALAGIDHVPDQEAARADAMAVVALTYAGFTGTWPLPGPSGGLPPAPRVASSIAAPSELAAGVPNDLDALCRLTFAQGQGPTTPGDFARQIAPWSPIPVMIPTMSPGARPENQPDAFTDPELMPVRGDRSAQGPGQRRPDAFSARRPDRRQDRAQDKDVELDENVELDEDLGRGEGLGRTEDLRRDEDQRRSAAPPRGGQSGPGQPGRAQPGLGQPGPGRPGPGRPGAGQPGERPLRPARPAPAGASRPAQDARSALGAGTAAAAAREGAGGPATRPVPGGQGPKAPGEVPVAHRIPSPSDARPQAQSRPAGAPPGSRAPGAPPTVPPLPPATPAAPLGASPVASTAARTASAIGAATSGFAKSLSERLSDTREWARDKVEELRERREAAAGQRTAGMRSATDEDLASGDAYDETHAYALDAPDGGSARPRAASDYDELEPPIPLLPPSAAEPLTKDESRLAIGIIVGFLAVALALGLWGLSRLPSSLPGLTSDPGTTMSTPDPETGASGEDEDEDDGAEAPGDDSAGPPAAAGQPLTFTQALDYDPLGGGDERPDELPLILDGDESTAWGSEGYRNTAFSNLKAGVGVILDLGSESSISAVNLVLPLDSKGEIYVSSDESLWANRPALPDDLSPAGTFDGEGSVTVDLADGTSGRYVVVWFTEISSDGQWFRARLAEASATS